MQFDEATPGDPAPAKVVTPDATYGTDDGLGDTSVPMKTATRVISNPDGTPIGDLAPSSPAGNANAPAQMLTQPIPSAPAASEQAQQEQVGNMQAGLQQAQQDAQQDREQDQEDDHNADNGSDGGGGGGANKRGGYIKPKRAGGGNVEAALAMLRRKSKASSDKSNVVNKALKIARRA